MATCNPLNIFRGQDALKQYFDPDQQHPTPLIELPPKLNAFASKGIRIFAKMLTAVPAQNVKSLPAINMLANEPTATRKRIVEASSGSTVTALSLAARVLYDNDDTTAYCTNKCDPNRLRLLQFFGLKVELYGGPAQQEPTDERSIIQRARRTAQHDPESFNPGQYNNDHNWQAHERWTGPQIFRQLPEIDIFCMGAGTTGCITGTSRYLKSRKASVKTIGVCCAEDDPIPGPRTCPLMEYSPFPWQSVVDHIQVVNSVRSFRLSMQLSRNGIIAGPSSGLALQGLLDYLEHIEGSGQLENMRHPNGADICCVFICCDLPQLHLDSYFAKLGPGEFHPIKNEALLDIDQLFYNLKWELDCSSHFHAIPAVLSGIAKAWIVRREDSLVSSPRHSFDLTRPASALSLDHPPGQQFVTSFSQEHQPFAIIDIRNSADFVMQHVSGSYNEPLEGIDKDTPSLFDVDDTTQLHAQWKSLNAYIKTQSVVEILQRHGHEPLVVLDYDGSTSRMATAILRARGIAAYSIMHGYAGLAAYLTNSTCYSHMC